MKKSLIKIICLLVIIGLNWTGLSAVLNTFAYFNDTENSNNNLFQAAIFDFLVTNGHIENFIGMEVLSEIESASVVMKTTGSLDIQYEVNVEKISGNDNFCNALQIELEHNGVEKHDGSLVSVSVPVTTQLGTWEFEIDLPVSAANVPHGAECNVDLVFKGWRSDVINFEDSGFTDEERIELRLTSRMIVLNEFLPNPSGLVPNYGFDFGDDASTQPQGEWVELYNNSNTSHDLADWYIWDASSDASNKIFITSSNTYPATTIISGKSWLVVYMNKEVFDNGGDTVKLFNQNDELLDSYTYTDSDYCELEPTPGDENPTTASGSCGGVPGNKSYARIPDGIGYWVDPIPTPGWTNRLSGGGILSTESTGDPISGGVTFDGITTGGVTTTGEIIITEATTTEATTTEATTTDEVTTTEATSTEEATTTEEIIIDETTIIDTTTTDSGQEVTTTEETITAEVTTETSGETTEDITEEVVGEITDETSEVSDETIEPIIEEATDEVVDETTVDAAEEPEPELEPEPEPEQIEETPVLQEPEPTITGEEENNNNGDGIYE